MGSLRVEGVTKSYGGTNALGGVSLEVADGELVVLLGPSGCGKSTLLRIVAGLVEPDGGSVWIDGRDVTAVPPAARDVAMVFQSYALYPHLSVGRNLGFGLRARKARREVIEGRVGAVAEQLGLSGLLDRRPRELSGGQRQRVALGRAMVRDPKVFLMDEPLSNLDAQLRSSTRDEIVDLQRRLGATFVYVTHDQTEAMTMATRIVVMRDGSIEQAGTPREIYEQPSTTFVSQFVGSPPMNLVHATVESRHGRLHAVAKGVDIELWPGSEPSRPILVGIRPEHLELLPPDGTGTGGGSGPEGGLAAKVTAVEYLGHEEVVRCDLGGGVLHARMSRTSGCSAGDGVRFGVDADHLAFFDPSSGRRLVWVPDDAGAARAPRASGAASGSAGLPALRA